MKRIVFGLILLMLINSIAVRVIAQSTDTTSIVGPNNGTLIIVGGGNASDEIWSTFLKAAGGKNGNIIIVPTASDDAKIKEGISKVRDALLKLGATDITFLHTRNPAEANTEAFVAPIRKATGVWFMGGRHWRLADSYLHTLAEKEFKAVLDRGGVIAGSSAGASIQGSFMVRGDTRGNKILIGDHTEGLGFIHNVTIDQHVMKRNRQFDLVEVIKKHPNLLGIGIDESTAIVVKKDSFEVIGNSYVAIYDINQIEGKAKNPSGDSGNMGPFYYLSKGQRFDLRRRKILDSGVKISND